MAQINRGEVCNDFPDQKNACLLEQGSVGYREMDADKKLQDTDEPSSNHTVATFLVDNKNNDTAVEEPNQEESTEQCMETRCKWILIKVLASLLLLGAVTGIAVVLEQNMPEQYGVRPIDKQSSLREDRDSQDKGTEWPHKDEYLAGDSAAESELRMSRIFFEEKQMSP